MSNSRESVDTKNSTQNDSTQAQASQSSPSLQLAIGAASPATLSQLPVTPPTSITPPQPSPTAFSAVPPRLMRGSSGSMLTSTAAPSLLAPKIKLEKVQDTDAFIFKAIHRPDDYRLVDAALGKCFPGAESYAFPLPENCESDTDYAITIINLLNEFQMKMVAFIAKRLNLSLPTNIQNLSELKSILTSEHIVQLTSSLDQIPMSFWIEGEVNFGASGLAKGMLHGYYFAAIELQKELGIPCEIVSDIASYNSNMQKDNKINIILVSSGTGDTPVVNTETVMNFNKEFSETHMSYFIKIYQDNWRESFKAEKLAGIELVAKYGFEGKNARMLTAILREACPQRLRSSSSSSNASPAGSGRNSPANFDGSCAAAAAAPAVPSASPLTAPSLVTVASPATAASMTTLASFVPAASPAAAAAAATAAQPSPSPTTFGFLPPLPSPSSSSSSTPTPYSSFFHKHGGSIGNLAGLGSVPEESPVAPHTP